MIVDSVGDAEIQGFKATVRVVPPGGKAKVVELTIPKAGFVTPTGEGNVYFLRISKFKKTFPPKDPKASVEEYKIEAYLEQKLGGDNWTGKPIIVKD